MLNYKTRAMSHPQGKQRVYLCCHPDELDTYLPSLSSQILTYCNCSVWYPKDPNVLRDEEYLSHLSQMQLFVMPVTYSLLCQDNPALDKEFRFALEHHIPILPLLQDSNLVNLFNEKCGNLQFLDVNSQDTTVKSYDDKFSIFLSNVLVGDELVEKIRAAFDGYIFLRYRKKDRKYAQKLMQLIHKNDFCQNVAIWYDEYLIPGEDYNDSISSALDNSSLFVMAVTPNLVCEENYVTSVEYPMAKELGKTILPVEMVSTDRSALTALYDQIPDCIDVHNEAELSYALHSHFSTRNLSGANSSSEHKYLIGMAYLNGIDVEVDHQRAIMLLTSAADAGHLQAINQLIVIYLNGVGVPTNTKNALYWAEKNVELLEQDYCKKSTQESFIEFLTGLTLCVSVCFTIQHYKKAEHYAHMALDWTNKTSLYSSDSTIQALRLELYIALCNTKQLQFQLKEALFYHQKARSLTLQQYENDPSDQNTILLAKLHMISSDIAFKQLKRDEGIDYLNQAITYLESCLSATLETDRNKLLLIAYLILVRTYIAAETNDTFESAASLLQKAIPFCESVTSTVKPTYEFFVLSNLYREASSLAIMLDDPKLAFFWINKFIDLVRSCKKEYKHLLLDIYLSIAYQDLAIYYSIVAEDPASAKQYINESLNLINKVMDQDIFAYPQQSMLLAQLCSATAFAATTVDEQDIAIALWVKSNHIYESLYKHSASIDIARALVNSCKDLGLSYEGLEDLDNAQFYFEKAVVYSEKLAEQYTSTVVQTDLAEAYRRLADFLSIRQDFVTAITYSQKDISLSQTIIKTDPSDITHSNLNLSYRVYGKICERAGDFSQAETYYDLAISICKDAHELYNSPYTNQRLSVLYGNKAGLYEKQKRFLCAKTLYIEQLTLLCAYISSAANDEQHEVRKEIRTVFDNIINICEILNDLSGLLQWTQKKSHIMRKLHSNICSDSIVTLIGE